MNQSQALPAPCRVQIGKTLYDATPKPWEGEEAPGAFYWVIVARKGPKQEKSLFPDFSGNYSAGTCTLWSKANGMRRGCGLPKLVKPVFFTGPELVENS